MPKYRPETEKAKTKSLIKAYSKSGFNQSRLAEKEGVSQAAISQRLKRAPVKKTMAELLDRIGVTDSYLNKKIKEGIEAQRVVINETCDGEKVPDMYARHKYIVTALELKGHIKHNGNGKGVSVSTIIFNFRNSNGLFSESETSLISSERS